MGFSYFTPNLSQTLDFEKDTTSFNWQNLKRDNTESNIGNFSSKVSESMEYGPAFTDTNIDFSRKKTIVIGNAFIYPEQMRGGSLVLVVNKNGRDLYYKEIALYKITTIEKKWQSFYFQYNIPPIDLKNCELKFFFYNPSGSSYYIDDLNLRVFTDFGYSTSKPQLIH